MDETQPLFCPTYFQQDTGGKLYERPSSCGADFGALDSAVSFGNLEGSAAEVLKLDD